MRKKRILTLIFTVICCAVIAGTGKLMTAAAANSASVGNFAAIGGKVAIHSEDIDYLNKELDRLHNEVGDYAGASASANGMVSADAKQRRSLLISHGIVNYDDSKAAADTAGLFALADRTDALGNTYTAAVSYALNQMGTYFDSGGSINHSSQASKSLVLGCEQLARGILQSQSVSHLNASPVTSDNITAGAAAWVNGRCVIGNGADNDRAYQRGLSDGAAGNSDNVELHRVCHEHTGNSGKNPIPDDDVCCLANNPGGCYTASGHVHNAGGLDCGLQQGDGISVESSGTDGEGRLLYQVFCRDCFASYEWRDTPPARCYICGNEKYTSCTNQNNQWTIGCGKKAGQLEDVTIVIRRNAN